MATTLTISETGADLTVATTFDAKLVRGVLWSTTSPTDGQVPQYNASGSIIDWVDPDSLLTGGFVNVTGDTMTGALIMQATLQMEDGKQLQFGTGTDYWMEYDATGTQFRFRTTDADGAGADGTIFSVQDGVDDVVFAGDITAVNLTGTLQTAAQPNITTVGTLVSGAVPASLVTAGTFGTGAYVFDSTVSGITTLTATTLAGTLSTAAQPNVTSLGTLVSLQVDNLLLDGNTLSSTAGVDLLITPLAGQQIVLDGAIIIDAGVVTGATSITSTSFVGALTGNADTATALQTARNIGGVSFDGSASIVPSTITVADTVNTTCSVALFEAATGALAPKSDAGLTYNAGTGLLTATGFSGPLTGAVTGNADTATVLATPRDINGVAFDGSANITITAAAGTLTGTVLNATVVSSSLTSLGTIGSLVATTADIDGGTIDGAVIGGSARAAGSFSSLTLGTSVTITEGAADRLDLASGDSLNIVSGALQFAGSTVISSSQNLVLAGTGPHAIGGATVAATQLGLRGSHAGTKALHVTTSLTPGLSTSASLVVVAGTIVEHASGVHPEFVGLEVQPPTITVGVATLANATTLKITGAPTATVTGAVRAFWVTSGLSEVQALTVVGTLTATLTGNADTATTLATPRTIGGVSFDGSANIVPDTITVADTADATSFVGLWESATGDLAPKTDAALTYDATTGALTAASFVGALTGNASTATALETPRNIGGVAFDGTGDIVPQTIQVVDSTDASSSVAMFDSATGSLQPKTDAGLTYNATTGVLSATGFAGPLTGAVTGNADTATVLQTPRDINGVAFDGSASITITAAAGTLTGTVLNGTVVSSSLTSLGTIGSLVATTADIATLSRAGDQTIDLTGATTRTLTLQNSTASQVANLDVDGVYVWRAGHATGTYTFAGTPTVARTLTWPDASITVNAAADISGTTLASGVVTSSLTTIGTLVGGAVPANFVTAATFAAGTYSFAGSTISDLGSVTTADINGGTIDGTVIGGSVAAAGSFTTLSASSLITATAGVLYGTTVTLTEGSANVLELATGDSFNIVSGDLTVGGNIAATGVGPHAFGRAVEEFRQFMVGGSFAAGGSSLLAQALIINTELTGAVGNTKSLSLLHVAGTITTQGTDTDIDYVASVVFAEPVITNNLGGAAQIGIAATVYIAGAPDEGVVNAALYVASGAVILQGTLAVTGDVDINGGTVGGVTLDGTISGTPTWASNQAIVLSTASQPNITALGTIISLVATTADINGGTLDNVVIGGSVAAAGSFTTLGASGNLTVLGVGPHAFGRAAEEFRQFMVGGSFAAGGSSLLAQALIINTELTGAVGNTKSLSLLHVAGTITTQGTDTDIIYVASAVFDEPGITNNLTGAAEIGVAAAVYISKPPTEGVLNAGLFVKLGDVMTEAGMFTMKEITTPTAITDWGRIYTKNTNKLFFQDGAGTEHEVAFV